MLHRLFLGLLCLCLIGGPQRACFAALQSSVNAILGDRSYVQRFGHLPGPEVSEHLRLQTHLAFVEQQLRRHTPQAIPKALYAQRARNLDLLSAYWQAGVFPSQNAYPGRRPHFIDAEGRLCAVGHLIAQTAGRGLAECVNARYRYAYLPEIQMPELQAWVAASGLTARELAMIQPSYGVGRLEPVIELNSSGTLFYTWLCLGSLFFLSLGLPLFHIFSFAGSSEDYPNFQAFDQGMTYFILGMTAALNLLSPILSPNNAAFLLLGAVALLIFVPVNLALLNSLDEYHRNQRLKGSGLSLGPLPLADGSSAWGLQAFLPF